MLPAGAKAKAITAGFSHGLAIARDGRVLAWGNGRGGQLGDGTATSSDVPVRVSVPAGVTVTGLTAGDGFSLARTSKGKVLAWGTGPEGELGVGAPAGSTTPVCTPLPPGVVVRGLFAGLGFALALTSKGKVLGWGNNDFGQQADGTTTERARRSGRNCRRAPG